MNTLSPTICYIQPAKAFSCLCVALENKQQQQKDDRFHHLLTVGAFGVLFSVDYDTINLSSKAIFCYCLCRESFLV